MATRSCDFIYMYFNQNLPTTTDHCVLLSLVLNLKKFQRFCRCGRPNLSIVSQCHKCGAPLPNSATPSHAYKGSRGGRGETHSGQCSCHLYRLRCCWPCSVHILWSDIFVYSQLDCIEQLTLLIIAVIPTEYKTSQQSHEEKSELTRCTMTIIFFQVVAILGRNSIL